MLGTVKKIISPAFYKGLWASAVATTHAEIRAGSIKPMFKCMLITGLVMYSAEYYVVGRE